MNKKEEETMQTKQISPYDYIVLGTEASVVYDMWHDHWRVIIGAPHKNPRPHHQSLADAVRYVEQCCETIWE